MDGAFLNFSLSQKETHQTILVTFLRGNYVFSSKTFGARLKLKYLFKIEKNHIVTKIKFLSISDLGRYENVTFTYIQ